MSKTNLNDSLEVFHNRGYYLPKRLIWIGSGFEDDQTEEIIKNIYTLDLMNHQPITLLINSDGGDVYNVKGIYDAILHCSSHVVAICFGKVMSSATLLLQACDERILMPNTKFMIHVGQESYPEDHPSNMERWYEVNKDIKKWMEMTYLNKIKEKHPKYTKTKLDKLLVFDTILKSKEAVDLGLADKIYGQ